MNPYQKYFDARVFEQFDACDFFEFYEFQYRNRQDATHVWTNKVIPAVRATSVKHANALVETFNATQAVREDFWKQKKEQEESVSPASRPACILMDD